MIGKISRGKGVGGFLRYAYGPGRQNEHSNPHLVAAWGDRPVSMLEPGEDTATLGRLLSAPMGYAPSPEKEVWQCSLSTDGRYDRLLTDDEWANIARDVMDSTGLAKHGDPGGVRWVALRHGLSDKGNDHIHIAAVMARQDGAAVRNSHDYRKVEQACRRAEERYGLTRVPSPDGRGTKDATYAEREKAARRGHVEPERDTLRREVRIAAAAASSREEFFTRLRDAGLVVKERKSVQDPTQTTGYAVSLPSSAINGNHRAEDGRAVFYSGGRLAGDLTLPQLETRWRSFAHTAPESERLVSQHAESAPRQAARAVRDATRRPMSPTVAAGARDVMLAAARNTEGKTRGPLTQTADRFARTTSGRGHVALSLAAARMLQHPQRDDQATAELLAALAALAIAVAEMHAQAQRAQQAAEARAAAAELKTWRPVGSDVKAAISPHAERRYVPPPQQAQGPVRRR